MATPVKATPHKQRKIKIVVIGDTNCGKSALIRRFMATKDKPYSKKVGAAQAKSTPNVQQKNNYKMRSGVEIDIQVWDTDGGQEMLTVTRSDFRHAQGIIVVYDITNQKSFENSFHWFAELERFSNKTQKPAVMLLGNKLDLAKGRQVKSDTAQGEASSKRMLFRECSAESGENVMAAFEEILNKAHIKMTKLQPSKKKPDNDTKGGMCTLL